MKIVKFFRDLNPVILACTVISAVLIGYGFVARWYDIYFFWESTNLGLGLIICSLGVKLGVERMIKRGTFSEYFRRGWLTLFHGLFTIMFIGLQLSLNLSDSMKVARDWIKNDPETNERLGNVVGFGWLVFGSTSSGNNSKGSYTISSYHILVKGRDKYEFVDLNISRFNREPWDVSIAPR